MRPDGPPLPSSSSSSTISPSPTSATAAVSDVLEKCPPEHSPARGGAENSGGFWWWRGRSATRRPSEYELVQSCTDSLAADSAHDEEDGEGGLVTVAFGR